MKKIFRQSKKFAPRSTPKISHLEPDKVRSSPKATHPGKVHPGKNLGKHLRPPKGLPIGKKIGAVAKTTKPRIKSTKIKTEY